MKQYTTPTITIRVNGQANLLSIADQVVVAAKSLTGEEVVIDDDRLDIEDDVITLTLTTSETAALVGKSIVEVTIITGEKVYKTANMVMLINEAIWDNGDEDD